MKSFCLTDVGEMRKSNQDFVYASDQPVGKLKNLFIVADGMGGHNAGDLASRLAVEAMVDHIENDSERRPIPLLEAAVSAANKAVLEKALTDKTLAGMGTTVVACTVDHDCVYIANVGDSRLYLLGDEITQITRDHSLVEEMVRGGQLSRSDARTHPEKNIITKAVGMKQKMYPDLFDVSLLPGERILLCSDGLTNMVEDKEILYLASEETDPEAAVRRLVETANRNGGTDNISVILVEPDVSGV